MDAEKIAENVKTLLAEIYRKKPSDAKAGYVHCDQIANGTYILVATVNNGAVTYSWQART